MGTENWMLVAIYWPYHFINHVGVIVANIENQEPSIHSQ